MKTNYLSDEINLWSKRWDVIQLAEIPITLVIST
jgi:hypothetical protein